LDILEVKIKKWMNRRTGSTIVLHNKIKICFMNSIKLISLTTFFILLSHFAMEQNEKINLGFDTLSIEQILEIQNDSDYPAFKIDSVQVELFYKGERFAIIPQFLLNEVNPEYIKSTEYKSENFGDNKIMLRIISNMIFK
jgi:hypothetical protein